MCNGSQEQMLLCKMLKPAPCSELLCLELDEGCLAHVDSEKANTAQGTSYHRVRKRMEKGFKWFGAASNGSTFR